MIHCDTTRRIYNNSSEILFYCFYIFWGSILIPNFSQWCRDNLLLIDSLPDIERIALDVRDNGGTHTPTSVFAATLKTYFFLSLPSKYKEYTLSLRLMASSLHIGEVMQEEPFVVLQHSTIGLT